MATPYSVKVLNETSSTQDEARRQFTPGTPSVVVAHRQSVGRGRSGAGWLNAPRSLAVSVAFRPAWDSGSWPLIPLLAGLAARQVMESPVGLKWPNDVEKDGDKVAGILVEASAGGDEDGGSVVIAGMGVNLYWPDAPAGMAGLREVDPATDGSCLGGCTSPVLGCPFRTVASSGLPGSLFNVGQVDLVGARRHRAGCRHRRGRVARCRDGGRCAEADVRGGSPRPSPRGAITGGQRRGSTPGPLSRRQAESE